MHSRALAPLCALVSPVAKPPLYTCGGHCTAVSILIAAFPGALLTGQKSVTAWPRLLQRGIRRRFARNEIRGRDAARRSRAVVMKRRCEGRPRLAFYTKHYWAKGARRRFWRSDDGWPLSLSHPDMRVLPAFLPYVSSQACSGVRCKCASTNLCYIIDTDGL